MLRKTVTVLSLIGLLLSVGAWGVSYWHFLYVDGKFNIFLKSGWLDIHRGRSLQQHLDWATEVKALQQREDFSFLQDFLQDGYIESLHRDDCRQSQVVFVRFQMAESWKQNAESEQQVSPSADVDSSGRLHCDCRAELRTTVAPPPPTQEARPVRQVRI